jgi:uncharacterized RDD family membrane protein YckC
MESIVDHWLHRKLSIAITALVFALAAIPTYYVVIWAWTLGIVLYVVLFSCYMLVIMIAWHWLKDMLVLIIKERSREK